MSNFASFCDWLQLTKNNTVFFHSSTETITWDELRDFSDFDLDKPEFDHHQDWSIISSESPKGLLLGMLKLFYQNKSVVILDHRLDRTKKQNILKLLELHLQDQCPQTAFLLSSGSSGELKLIGLSFEAMIHSAQASLEFYREQKLSHWGLNLPLHHVGGLMILWRMIMAQGSVTQASLEELLAKSSKIDALSLVPTQLLKCLASSESLSSLKKTKLILLGGAACSDELYQKIEQHQLPVSLSYGSTETCSQIFATPLGLLSPSVGRSLDGVKLLSPTSSQQTEVISFKARQLFHAIINQDGLHLYEKERLYQTTDLGILSKNGDLIIKGRADQIFISGGENISPEEIENRLKSCPGLEEALIIPRSDAHFGQVGHLFYLGNSPSLRARLQEFIQKNLLPHERPKSLSKMPQSLMGAIKPLRAKGVELIKVWEKSSQTPLLFFHGFMGHPYDFDPLFEELIRGGVAPWRLKALSLPGHGSEQVDELKELTDFESYLDLVQEKYQKHFEKEFILYGYSLGARVSFQLLLRPSLQKNCLHLFCEGGHFGLTNDAEKAERQNKDEQLFSPSASHKEFADFLDRWHKLELFQGLIGSVYFADHLQRKLSAHHIPALYQLLQLTSTGKQNTTHEDLKKLKFKPSYFIGELDQKYSQYAQKLSSLGLVDSYPVKGASHNIHLMNPTLLAQKIHEILKA